MICAINIIRAQVIPKTIKLKITDVLLQEVSELYEIYKLKILCILQFTDIGDVLLQLEGSSPIL